MAMFDFLGFGSSPKKKPASGPHVTRNRKEADRQENLRAIKDAKEKNSAISGKLDADAAAKAASEKSAARKKKANEFWGNILGKNKG